LAIRTGAFKIKGDEFLMAFRAMIPVKGFDNGIRFLNYFSDRKALEKLDGMLGTDFPADVAPGAVGRGPLKMEVFLRRFCLKSPRWA
jgi:hypothetical protein